MPATEALAERLAAAFHNRRRSATQRSHGSGNAVIDAYRVEEPLADFCYKPMLNQISGYIPLAALIIVGGFLGFIVWRGNYKLGAYVVQVVAAFFLSSVAGFSLYILSSVMVTTCYSPGAAPF